MNVSSRPTFFDSVKTPKRRTTVTKTPTSSSPRPGSTMSVGSAHSVHSSRVDGHESPSTPILSKETYFAKGFGEHLANPSLSDVILSMKVGDGRTTFRSHTLILSFGSDYFKRVFSSDEWKEMQKKGQNDWQLDAVIGPMATPEVVSDLLQFLYEGTVDIEDKNVVPLLHTSKKLMIDRLKDACLQFLTAELGPLNAVFLATQAEKWEEGHVEATCLDMISQHFDDILQGEGVKAFHPLSVEQMHRLLSRKDLTVAREEDVLDVVLSYVKDVYPIEKVGDAHPLFEVVRLPFVRFENLLRIYKDRKKVGLSDELITEALAARLSLTETNEMTCLGTPSSRMEKRGYSGWFVTATPGFAVFRIPNFDALLESEGEFIRSAVFEDLKGIQWRMVLYPQGTEMMENCVSAFVEVYDSAENIKRIRELMVATDLEEVQTKEGDKTEETERFLIRRMIRIVALNQFSAAGSPSRASAKEFTHLQKSFGWVSFVAHTTLPELRAPDGSLTFTIHITPTEERTTAVV